MKNPPNSKLKVRSTSDEYYNAAYTPKPYNTDRSYRGAEATMRRRRTVQPKKDPNGFFTLLKGVFTLAALAAALNWFAGSLPMVQKGRALVEQYTDISLAQYSRDKGAADTNTVMAEEQPASFTPEVTEELVEIKVEKLPEAVIEEVVMPAPEPEVVVAAPEPVEIIVPEPVTTQPAVNDSDGRSYFRVHTYRATMFEHPTDVNAGQQPVAHGSEVIALDRQGDWVKIEVKTTGDVGYIHISQISG